MRALWLLVVVMMVPVSVACFGGDEEAPTATVAPPTDTPIREVTATVAPTRNPPTPFPTRQTPNLVASTVWLIDVRDGAVITLYESTEALAATARFEVGIPVVLTSFGREDSEVISFDLDGKELRREPLGVWGRCRESTDGAEVAGRFIDGVSCGPISPDGSRMVFWRDAGEAEIQPGFVVPTRDLWLVELQTGRKTRLGEGMPLCQGDSFFFPGWSPSSRYVHFGDCGGGGRIFLSDTISGATRQLANVLPTFEAEPSWSGIGEVVLYPSGDGGVIVEELEAGRREELAGVKWPVRFDPTGSFFFALPHRDATSGTTIYDGQTRRAVATLAGEAPYGLPLGTIGLQFVPVIRSGTDFVAGLENAPGCEGTTVYRNQAAVTCVERAYGPAFSPDGSQLVLSRMTGVSGPVEGPGFGSVSMDIYEMVVIDSNTGAERVLAEGALGGYPTPVVWNASGTHILVTWPFHYGP